MHGWCFMKSKDVVFDWSWTGRCKGYNSERVGNSEKSSQNIFGSLHFNFNGKQRETGTTFYILNYALV